MKPFETNIQMISEPTLGGISKLEPLDILERPLHIFEIPSNPEIVFEIVLDISLNILEATLDQCSENSPECFGNHLFCFEMALDILEIALSN